MYIFFSTDFAGFREILLIVRSCVIFGRFHEIVKLQNSRRPALLTVVFLSYKTNTQFSKNAFVAQEYCA